MAIEMLSPRVCDKPSEYKKGTDEGNNNDDKINIKKKIANEGE